MKYNQYDYTYAVANINAIYRKLLNTSTIEKMLSCATSMDAARVLVELGWHDGDNFDEILRNEVIRTFEYVDSLGGSAVTALFRTKYDFHNLKALVKSELAGSKADNLLIDTGNFKVDTLRKYVLERDYSRFPMLEECFENYGKLKDAQIVDIILDKAMFSELTRLAQVHKDIERLTAMLIDVHNSKTAARMKYMNKDLPRAFIDGGTVEFGVDTEFNSDEYDRFLDNARNEYFGIMPLYAYMVAKENEIQNARIILVCKNNGIENEVIRRCIK